MSKTQSWKETGRSKAQNLLAQTIPNKIFETKWSNSVKEKFGICFYVFFNCYS